MLGRAIFRVIVKKIPHFLVKVFKNALKEGITVVAFEEVEKGIVYVFEEIKGPLGDFLRNAPHMTVQVGKDIANVVDEALNEAIQMGETVIRGVVKDGEQVVFAVGKAVNTVFYELDYFVNHTIGEPVSREIIKFASTLDRATKDPIGTLETAVKDTCDNIVSVVESVEKGVENVVNDVGGFFRRLF